MKSGSGPINFVSQPSPERHPERFYVLGKLVGLNPKTPKNCRVIEIGCSSGQHLISMAERYPQAYFLGIDISEQSIQQAREFSRHLGIKNIDFQVQDLKHYKAHSQSFDYVICHGVYSWIAREASHRLLELCSECLSADGIAYVSHNVLPGWSYRQTIQESLRRQVSKNLSEAQRVSMARRFMQNQIQQLLGDLSPESLRLKDELEAGLARSDGFILYELLAEEACAAYSTSTFLSASEQGLYFFAEAQPRRMSAKNPLFAMGVASSVDPYQLEGMHDKMCMQSFRGSLFCKQNLFQQGELDLSVIEDFFICSPLVPESENQPDIHSNAELRFFNADQKTFPISEPILKSALLYLRTTWPRPIYFGELCNGAWSLLSDDECQQNEKLSLRRGLYQIMLRNDLEFFSADMGIANHLRERPQVSSFTRIQADQGWVTTLRNEYYPVNALEAFLVKQLDGTLTSQQLTERVLQLVESGQLEPRQDGQVITDKQKLVETVALEIQDCLESFMEIGLLLE